MSSSRLEDQSSRSSTDGSVPNAIDPPAFLDLADSAARLNSNLPDINGRTPQDIKRKHDLERAIMNSHYEAQMRALDLRQAQELEATTAARLTAAGITHSMGLGHRSPFPDPTSGGQLSALSAPTTPPRAPSVVNGDHHSSGHYGIMSHHQAVTNGLNEISTKANKLKTVNYAPGLERESSHSHTNFPSPDGPTNPHNGVIGAKSMPGSRRPSTGSKDGEDMVASLSLSTLNLNDTHNGAQNSGPRTAPTSNSQYHPVFNSGIIFGDELDHEMQNSLKYLPTHAEDDRFLGHRAEFTRKLSASSVALDLAPLDLAPLSQTPPRTLALKPLLKTSEWPQFSGQRTDSPSLAGTTVSASATPHIVQQLTPDTSRRSSPPGLTSDSMSMSSNSLSHSHHARSVPATPLNVIPSSVLSSNVIGSGAAPIGVNRTVDLGGPLGKNGTGLGSVSPRDHTGGTMTPSSSESQRSYTTPDLVGNSYSRIPSGGSGPNVGQNQFDNRNGMPFGSAQQHESSYGAVDVYGGGIPEVDRYDQSPSYDHRGGMANGSTALYQHGGSRYGLGIASGRLIGPDSKMNGLHGPKHKRGDMDREFNRFAGTRLEDLVGEIASLCKDQHGCRYLQKKLEEGAPEHRDIIFHETFNHFAELMTDPFGNYLCQKLLEYSTDEQRNAICDSVAQDLVAISLNMHGTRAVQKMIDFLSTQRQADIRYDAQIRSIIMALGLHVVTLIKDLNGNHVVQKCLNRLAPEDNQFIYNAVAAHCVEVATHRHGCCVLQRCIDHASDSQRVQLVTEITYNALTLVQDPYGNYVVQYILDLNDNRFSDGVIRQFVGNVCALSVQKFSSNVIEKCIRVAEHNTRKMLIEELLNRNRLEKLLRDSFGNYCVQTALDYAEPGQRMILVEGIRPILPLIRNTPYGKRIQSKLQREQMEAANAGGGAHYGGYHQSHPSLANISLSNGISAQGRHHIPQQSIHHSSQLPDPYNAGRSSLYSLGPSAALHAGQQSPLHPAQQLHHGLQQHSLDHAYGGSAHSILNGATQSSLTGSHYGNLGAYSNGGFGGSIGLGSGINDPYQRAAFPYAM